MSEISQNTKAPLSLLVAICGGVISLCGLYYAVQADITKVETRIDKIELRTDLEIKRQLTELATTTQQNGLAMKSLTERLDEQDRLQRDIWRDVRALRGFRDERGNNKP